MRSEEIALRLGPLDSVALGPGHDEARARVVRDGRRTGMEHGIALLDDGSLVPFGGDFQSRIFVPSLTGRDGSITLHHNHPIGDSLSRSDLRLLLGRPEVGRIDAHGHRGFWASAQRAGPALEDSLARDVVEGAALRARNLVSKAARARVITQDVAMSGLWMVVAARLLAADGVVRYAVNSRGLSALADQVMVR